MLTFGEKIKKLRIEKKLTQEELSMYMDVTRSVIGQWEQNRQWPNKETLIKLANFLNVPTDYLLGNLDWADQLPSELRNFVLNPKNRVWLELAPEIKKAGIMPETIRAFVIALLEQAKNKKD